MTGEEFGEEETPGGGADDFDDFTEGQDDMGDFDDADFGDFDDGFQEPSAAVPMDVEVSQPPTPPSVVCEGVFLSGASLLTIPSSRPSSI